MQKECSSIVLVIPRLSPVGIRMMDAFHDSELIDLNDILGASFYVESFHAMEVDFTKADRIEDFIKVYLREAIPITKISIDFKL